MPADASYLPVGSGRRGGALFVWHHAPPPSVRRGGAIVLCPPIGYEYMSAYRTVRILAERLAALGFDVLRIDYEGTGDSSGDYDQPCLADAWRRSVVCAVAEARRLAGSEAVAVVGIRAGALVAWQAMPELGTVDRLVLWGAFPSGQAYVRELKALAGLQQQLHADHSGDGAGLNASGYFMAEETVASISRWTMDAVVTPAKQILVVDRDDRPADPKLGEHLQKAGGCVTRIRPDGTAAMLELPEFARVPEPVLEEIVAWFRPWLQRSASARRVRLPMDQQRRCSTLETDDYRERPVRFGPGDRLFGILTSPRRQATDKPSIVLFNTGLEYHVGPHRLYVPLARYWAARGHHVLRYDLGGIGDSPPPPGAPENVAYPAHLLEDAREAIAFVQHEAAQRRVMAAGLCSGGWLAFRAAREGLDVEGVVAINPPLYLREGTAATQWVATAQEYDRYQLSLRNPSKWLKALSGGAAYKHFIRVSASALRRSVAARVGMPEGLASDLCTIAGRGVRTLFVFSGGDDGLQYLQWHAQPALRRARVRELVQQVVVEGAGHTFRPRAVQQKLRDILIDVVQSESCGVPK